jgi:hypothetical protein
MEADRKSAAKRRQQNERDRDQAFEFLKLKYAIIVILSKPNAF